MHAYIQVSVYITHTLIHKLTHLATATATFPLGAERGVVRWLVGLTVALCHLS